MRKHLLNHKLEIADPHLALNQELWLPLVKSGAIAVGSHHDYAAIAQKINELGDRLKSATPDKKWFTTIFDEVTQYAFKPETKGVSGALMLFCLADCVKAKESPILISHGDTIALTGGAGGTSETMEKGLVKLELLGTVKDGKPSPLFRGILTGLPNSEGKYIPQNVTLDPSVMSASYINKLFEVADREEEDIKLSDSLPEPLKSIWLYAKKVRVAVKASDVQRGLPKLVNPATEKRYPTEEIRVYFLQLAQKGYGEVEGEGDRLKFRVF
ncbi:MAG: hypothetical protein N3E45_17050 [Oscillatoriaceae bacterium SKW80]|nr:hypothetical protein [Oscillatoriaceae bacterium SKW80]HIK27967.1 hypothetical protein [Oscillatoriaceae cyanobacterium M7585_C2015_266]